MSRYPSIGEQMNAMPTNRGLYDPRFDHDACGVAFVARIAGGPAHEVVQSGLQALINLAHRGASGADPNSGDGAGILVQLPDEFLRRGAGTHPPAPGGYGVGFVFLPPDAADREHCERIVAEACADEGLRVLAWRDVPTDATAAGMSARALMPAIRQVFVATIGLPGGDV